ncbi:MAG TPA: hypothetical protein VM260_26955, partial [Pirellula sp.]|nr:hypothetical protein [Pirellula sp.]
MSTLTQRPVLSDLVAYESNPEYNRVAAVVKNATGSAIDLAGSRGLPVKVVAGVYCVCLEADLANAVGVII